MSFLACAMLGRSWVTTDSTSAKIPLRCRWWLRCGVTFKCLALFAPRELCGVIGQKNLFQVLVRRVHTARAKKSGGIFIVFCSSDYGSKVLKRLWTTLGSSITVFLCTGNFWVLFASGLELSEAVHILWQTCV